MAFKITMNLGPILVNGIRAEERPGFYYIDMSLSGVEHSFLVEVDKRGTSLFLQPLSKDFERCLRPYPRSNSLVNLVRRYIEGEYFEFPVDLNRYVPMQ
jgi:hypothetical protein